MKVQRIVMLGLIMLGGLAGACKQTTVEGPADRKLTLTKPADVSIERGGTEKVAVAVRRSNVSGPVTAKFNNLPNGVKVVDDTGEIAGDERTFVLTAGDDADLVENHVASVSLHGPSGMSVTEQFRVTVKEKS